MERIDDVQIENELQSSYIDYAMSVIVSRALPDARDGLKPVQRRILYSMYELNNTHDQPTKKSARIVGECFVKDTLVLTDKGLVPIQNIEIGNKVYTQEGIQNVSKLYLMPKRKLIKIILENGTENIVTLSQEFKVLTKDWKIIWKNAKDLENGDYLLTKSFYPEIIEEVKLGEKKLNENIAYLLGQLLSDGFVIHDNEHNKYHRVGFCSSSLDVITAINQCLDREFNYVPTIEEKHQEFQSGNGQVLLSTIYQLRVNNSVINKFFIETFNLLGAKAWSKRIPEQIFRSPKKVIFAFLSGLIDGDGHVHKYRTTIEYATTSKEIATQLMVLLHQLGIHGKRYELLKNGEGYILGKHVNLRDSYSLEFNGANAQKLAANLNLKKEERKRRALQLLKHPLKVNDFDILPWASEKIFSQLSEHHLGGGWYQDLGGEKFRSGIKYKGGMKIRYSSDLYDMPLHLSQIIEWGIKDKLAKIGSPLLPFIDMVLKNNIYFSQVVTIEEEDEAETYDIQVEDQHELVANGMITHNCIGKFHPHGDVAIYEALARMVQTFSLNHPLADGQGNFGSVDGDPPAAMRYTEVRLTRMAEEMLEDLEKDTVEMIPNFDNTEKEPMILPGKIPNLLVNGTSGIAVGVATSMPPHNLAEVCDAITYYLDHSDAGTDDILNIIKGPDFPTGGIAIMSEDAYRGYRFGKGRLTIRAKVEINKEDAQLVVTEIPYNVNKSDLIKNIADLAKQKIIVGISDIRDETDKEGIRIVIELRGDGAPDFILNSLYKHTQLEVTFPLINLAVIGNKLESFNILKLIKTFVDYRRIVVTRRSQFELQVAKDRMHIVEGLLIAITHIDNIVKDIRASKEVSEARAKLMNNYSLSEKQANAILDLRLSRLTGLEFDSLNSEKLDLEKSIIYYTEVLADPKKLDGIIREETLSTRKQYSKARKTQIVVSNEESDITEEDTIIDEKVSVIFTNGGYIKRMPATTYKEQGRGGRGVVAISLKEGDYVKQIITSDTKDYLVCISDKGRAYWLKAYRIPEVNRYAEGKAIVNLLNLQDEKIITILTIKDFENSKILFLTRKGLIKKVYAKFFSNPRSNGVKAIVLNDDDAVADVQLYTSEQDVFIATKGGKSIRFKENDIRFLGRTAMGVRGIRIRGSDEAKNIIPTREEGFILTITEKGFGKLTEVSKYRIQNRGGSGIINIKVSPNTGDVAKSLFVDNKSNVTLISSHGITITFNVDTIRITGRSAKGVRLMKLQDNAKVVDARLQEIGVPTVTTPLPPQDPDNVDLPT